MNDDNDIRVIKNQNGGETYVFDPYNPLNQLITDADIQNILRNYGIDVPIKNYTLYKRAFIHRSYVKRPNNENEENNVIIADQPADCLPLYTKSNERMEFVGDGVLELSAKYYLYRRFPKENEGFMTEKKIALVKNEAIGKITHEMGLQKWFVLSKNAEAKQTRSNLKKLGCLFEAFIGAIFLDFNKIEVKDEDRWFENTFVCGPGFQMAQIFIENVFEKHVDWINLIKNDDNYKNQLQVRIQKEFKVTPHYVEVEEHNADMGYHMGVYLCIGQPIHAVSVSHAVPIAQFGSYQAIHEYASRYHKVLVVFGTAKHRIKKKAEQMACEEAIMRLQGFV